MKWIFNGLLVQDINDSYQKLTPYLGIGRFVSWPLNKIDSKISKALTEEAEERWFNYYHEDKYALAVVPSMDYIKRYLNECKKLKIKTRVLYIETTRETPRCLEKISKLKFLGYDYATSQDFFSALYDDLYGSDTPSNLVYFKNQLNSNGLFNNENDLICYVESRNKSIADGYELECFGDFCKFKISLVSDLNIFENYPNKHYK